LGPNRKSRLHPQGRARRRQAAEHRHLHVPAREPVLEIQPRRVSEAAGVLTRLPAVPPLL